MTCDFTSFSTVIQSYQDDGQVIMKGDNEWNPFTTKRSPHQAGLTPGPTRSVSQGLTYQATGDPDQDNKY